MNFWSQAHQEVEENRTGRRTSADLQHRKVGPEPEEPLDGVSGFATEKLVFLVRLRSHVCSFASVQPPLHCYNH